jgi:hypothetical protein
VLPAIYAERLVADLPADEASRREYEVKKRVKKCQWLTPLFERNYSIFWAFGLNSTLKYDIFSSNELGRDNQFA